MENHIIIINNGLEYDIKYDTESLQEDIFKLGWGIANYNPKCIKDYNLSFMKTKMNINKDRFKCSY